MLISILFRLDLKRNRNSATYSYTRPELALLVDLKDQVIRNMRFSPLHDTIFVRHLLSADFDHLLCSGEVRVMTPDASIGFDVLILPPEAKNFDDVVL